MLNVGLTYVLRLVVSARCCLRRQEAAIRALGLGEVEMTAGDTPRLSIRLGRVGPLYSTVTVVT